MLAYDLDGYDFKGNFYEAPPLQQCLGWRDGPRCASIMLECPDVFDANGAHYQYTQNGGKRSVAVYDLPEEGELVDVHVAHTAHSSSRGGGWRVVAGPCHRCPQR